MRTTLNIDDELMRQVKRRAIETGQTATQVIEEALRQLLLGRPHDQDTAVEFRWVTVRGHLLPGVDLDDRDALYDRMDGRR